MEGYTLCGTGKRCITPDKDLMGRLFCVMPRTKFEMVDDDLFVRAIAVKNSGNTVLFIHYELDQAPFPSECVDSISWKYGVPTENIFVLGDHSHEIPVTGVRLAEPQHNEMRASEEFYEPTVKYEEQVLSAMYEAVDEALTNMQPARIGWGEGESFINEHREMKYASIFPVDRSLFVMKIESLEGVPLAFMLNYSAHNSCVKLDYALSPDMEGCISRLVENHFEGSVCMWTLSAHGDLMPRADYKNILVSTENVPEFADPEKTDNEYFKRKRVISLRQYEDALSIIDGIKCEDVPDLKIAGDVEFAKVKTHPIVENPDGSITHMGGLATISAEARASARPRTQEAIENALSTDLDEYKLRLHLVRLGGLVFVGNGGKLYNHYKMMIRGMIPVEYTSVMLSQDFCETSNITYVWDDRAIIEQASNLTPVRVCPGEIGEGIRTAIKTMLDRTGTGCVG